MLTLNVIGTEDDKVITGSINGEKFSVTYNGDMYTKLLVFKEELEDIETMEEYNSWVEEVKALLNTDTSDIITTACPDLIKSEKGYYHIKVDGKISKKAVPQPIVDVILKSVEQNINADPIIKAWIRFLRNPNFTPQKADLFARYITATIVDHEEVERLMVEEGFVNSKAVLRATYNDVAITQEGLIVGKKYARLLTHGWKIDPETNKPIKTKLYDREDDQIDMHTGKITEGKIKDTVFNEDLVFEPPIMRTNGDAFTCGQQLGHVIKVGNEHSLESWKMVDTNDNHTCVPGLHIGGWQYVQNYKGLNCQLLECFVDPAEIGAICDISYGDGAMRVKSYFIFGGTEGRNKGIYHSSKYAAMKDKEWEKYKKEAVERSNKLMTSFKEEVEELGM